MSFNEKKSYTEYNVTSSTSDFAIGFKEYGLPSDTIKVTVDNVAAAIAGYTVTRKNDLELTLTPPVSTGVVRLQRETNIDESFHVFSAGAKFVTANMDSNFNQILHSQQEVVDGFDKLKLDVYPLVNGLEEALEQADAASQAAQEAAQAAEGAAQLSRSTDNVQYVEGFTQTLFNDGIKSIADFPTTNLRTGLRVYVKSYHPNLNAGGGWFTYDASKAAINNEITIINGWVRDNKGYLCASDGGARVDLSIDNTLNINNVIKVASDSNINTVYLDGKFMIGTLEQGITTTPFGNENAWWLLKARSNVTLVGSRKDGLFIKAGLASANVGQPNTKGYMVIGDYNQPNVENFHMVGFTIDNNGQNNLAPPAIGFSQPLCPNVWFQRGTNITVTDVHFFENSGHQTIVLDSGVNGGRVSNCLFTDNGKGLLNNVECVDHSSIYIRGDRITVNDNVLMFTNGRKPDLSTALEIHGTNCNVYGNTTIGYPFPLIRASFFGQSSTNVKVHDNNFVDCNYGLNLDGAANSPLDVDVYNNRFLFRAEKPTDGRAQVAIGHTVAGGFVGVSSSSTHDINIRVRNNLFIQPTPTGGWSKFNEFDNAIWDGGKCTDVTIEGNTFIGFKSGYRINYLNGRANYRFNNTLINCGSLNTDLRPLILCQNVDGAWSGQVKNVYNTDRLEDCKYLECVYYANTVLPKYTYISGYSTNWILPYNGEDPHVNAIGEFTYTVRNIDPNIYLYAQSAYAFGKIKLPSGQYFWKYAGNSGRWNMHRDMPVVPTTPRFFGDIQGDTVTITNPTAGSYLGYVCTVSGATPATVGTWKGHSLIQS